MLAGNVFIIINNFGFACAWIGADRHLCFTCSTCAMFLFFRVCLIISGPLPGMPCLVVRVLLPYAACLLGVSYGGHFVVSLFHVLISLPPGRTPGPLVHCTPHMVTHSGHSSPYSFV